MIKTVINEHPNSRESATLARNSSTNIHVSEFAWFMIIKNRAFNQLKSIKKKISLLISFKFSKETGTL